MTTNIPIPPPTKHAGVMYVHVTETKPLVMKLSGSSSVAFLVGAVFPNANCLYSILVSISVLVIFTSASVFSQALLYIIAGLV